MVRVKKTEEKVEKKAKVSKPKKVDSAVESAVETKAVKKVSESKPTVKDKAGKLLADVLDLEGRVVEKISIPEEIFGVKPNKVLISQAVRVFLANQRQGNASTKTRGEVEGSTRKIYRQKGTGRARHGSIRAPIFVHGGIVGGPKPRDFGLQLPKKMKRAAMFGALSSKFKSGELKIIQGFEKIEPKTKKFVEVAGKLGLGDKKKKILVITSAQVDNIRRAAGNVEGITLTGVKNLNAHDILNNRNLLFMKEAVEELKNHFFKKKEKANS